MSTTAKTILTFLLAAGGMSAAATDPARPGGVALPRPAHAFEPTQWFSIDTEGFVTWITERTNSLVHAYDVEMRDADLETVTHCMQAKARRTLPFATPDQRARARRKEPEAMLLFLGEDRSQS